MGFRGRLDLGHTLVYIRPYLTIYDQRVQGFNKGCTLSIIVLHRLGTPLQVPPSTHATFQLEPERQTGCYASIKSSPFKYPANILPLLVADNLKHRKPEMRLIFRSCSRP